MVRNAKTDTEFTINYKLGTCEPEFTRRYSSLGPRSLSWSHVGVMRDKKKIRNGKETEHDYSESEQNQNTE
jgi:hypothetical protein